MAAMTRPGRLMGPLKAGDAGTSATAVSGRVGASIVEGVAVGIAVGIGVRVGGSVAAPPHAEIPARSAAIANTYIARGHRYILKF